MNEEAQARILEFHKIQTDLHSTIDLRNKEDDFVIKKNLEIKLDNLVDELIKLATNCDNIQVFQNRYHSHEETDKIDIKIPLKTFILFLLVVQQQTPFALIP